ncbi:hypothetical protein [Rhodococcus sp. 06-418-5]|uniref:hypothetical protein n=1 Tax=Rhodococcus sp. 06-418-5 TaxID=2022507 RepID=UPI00211AA8A5|nr:hypothetical protein [Rhodococcus sp. 06-418-5]
MTAQALARTPPKAMVGTRIRIPAWAASLEASELLSIHGRWKPPIRSNILVSQPQLLSTSNFGF